MVRSQCRLVLLSQICYRFCIYQLIQFKFQMCANVMTNRIISIDMRSIKGSMALPWSNYQSNGQYKTVKGA